MREPYVLGNGLKLYVEQKQRKDCALYLVVNAGQFHNVVPETAHILEHIAGISAKVYGDNGPLRYASGNAHTNSEITVYEFATFLPEDLSAAAEALSNTLLTQSYSFFEREKTAVRHELLGRKTPEEALSKAVMKRLYPEIDLYAPTIDERLASLEKMAPDVAESFWAKNYSPANVYVYAVGNVSNGVSDLVKILERIPARENRNEPFVWPKRTFLKEPDLVEVACLQMPVATVSVTYSVPFTMKNNLEEFVALWFLEEFLSASSGPMYSRLRDKLGLCYACGASRNVDQTGTDFQVFAQTSHVDIRLRIASELQNMIGLLGQNGVPADAVEQFKKVAKLQQLQEAYHFDLKGFVTELKTGRSRAELGEQANCMTSEVIFKVTKELVNRPRLISIALPLNS